MATRLFPAGNNNTSCSDDGSVDAPAFTPPASTGNASCRESGACFAQAAPLRAGDQGQLGASVAQRGA